MSLNSLATAVCLPNHLATVAELKVTFPKTQKYTKSFSYSDVINYEASQVIENIQKHFNLKRMT